MTLCGSGHEDIVFATDLCPLCDTMRETEEMEKQIERLNNELDELEEKREDIIGTPGPIENFQ